MEDFYDTKYLDSSVALSSDIGNENLSYHSNHNNLYRNSWRCGAGSGHFFGSLENNILAARNDQFVNDITKSSAFHSSFLRHPDSLNPVATSLYGFDHLTIANNQVPVSSTSSSQFFSNDQLSSPPSNIYSNIGLISSSSSIGYPMDAKLFAGISQNNAHMYNSMPGNSILSRYPNMAAMASFTHTTANYCLPIQNNVTPPSQVSSAASSHSVSPQQFTLPHQIQGQLNYDPRELEIFSERFKQRRIKLGVTQADVGKALGNLKLSGVGSLSQSTICRFESLTLSHNNMVALKPILQAWLEEAERQAAERLKNPDIYNDSLDRKRKRTSITDAEKRSLEAYFAVQPRPSSEKIAQIADKLNLKKNVVRVWFCNQRQKQKRMKFSTVNLDHHSG